MYPNLGNTEILMYDIFGYISFLSLVLFNFFSKPEKQQLKSKLLVLLFNHLSKSPNVNKANSKNVFLFLETFVVSVVQFIPVVLFNVKFGNLINTNANYFGLLYFAPFVLFLFFFLFFFNPLEQLNQITPAYPLALFFAKLSCFCSGCCRGIENPSGLFNHKTDQLEIPIQLIEAGLALLIFFFFLYYQKKAAKGTLFSIYMILYSFTRFFSEFLRAEPATFFGLKTYQILCIIGVIIGIIELFIVKIFRNHILNFYNMFYEFSEKKFNSYVASVKKKRAKNIIHHKKKKR